MSRPGARADHDAFARIEGWTEVRNARGQAVRHHITYELELPDGRVLRTRISRPANRESYGPALWKLILTEQLSVTEEQFWACVKDRRLPDRGGDSGDLPSRALPAQLVFQLLNIGLPETQVAQMTLEEAVATMTEHWSRPRE